jgi:hypothetical protein
MKRAMKTQCKTRKSLEKEKHKKKDGMRGTIKEFTQQG